MSKISNAILKTLLEEVTDYQEVNLSKKQYEKLQDICDRWEDKDSIENEINTFLKKNSYEYNHTRFVWTYVDVEEELATLSVTISKSDFEWLLEHYRDNGIVEHIVNLTMSKSQKAQEMFTEKFRKD